MYYTQWSSTDYYNADTSLTTSVFYGPSQTLDASTFTGQDFATTFRVRLLWPGGTSTAAQTATRYTEATQIATERDSDGNITNVNNINGDANETVLAPFGGGATASRSFPVTYRPTQTVSFQITYTTIGSGSATTALTATATATRESAATATSSMSGLTTVSQFATGISGLYFTNVRENPEFNGINRFYSNFGRTAGEGLGVTGRRVAAAFTGGSAAGTYGHSNSVGNGASIALSLPNTLSVSLVEYGALTAKRKILSVAATSDVIYLSTGTNSSFYTASSADNSDLTNIPSLLIPLYRQGGFYANTNIGTNIMTPRIFTNAEIGFSINSSSATANWSYQSSSWILYTTLANSSTRTSGSAQILFSGPAQTTTYPAWFEWANQDGNWLNTAAQEGVTHGHLGPAIPLTLSGLNEISVSSVANFISSRAFFMRTQQCTTGCGTDVTNTGRTGTFATSLSSFNGSTSTAVALGSATSPRAVATYAHTLLTAAVGVGGVVIATRTTAAWSTADAPPHPFSLAANKASKWNEAGQANFVSVRNLPAARTAFL